MNVKLSYIVPIYNVAKYLRKCVDSLMAQDYEDYEIILVDDGSTDSCPSICDEYVRLMNEGMNELTNERIKVIHRENGGLSAARNSGIEVAQGEYIMFVDSDDYIEPNVLKGLIAQMERDNLDVLRYRLQYVRIVDGVQCKVYGGTEKQLQYEVYNPYKSDPFKGNDYSEIPIDGVSFLNSRMNTQCYAWQFVIKRDLIYSNQSSVISNQNFGNNTLHTPHYTSENNVLFTSGIYFEDTDWTPRMLCKAQRVASTETVVYNYLMREGSITNAVNRSKQKKVLDDKMRLVLEMQKQSKDLQTKGMDNRWFDRMIVDTVISIIGILSVQFYQERKEYLDRLKQYGVYPLKSSSTKARLINLSPCLTVELLHLKNH